MNGWVGQMHCEVNERMGGKEYTNESIGEVMVVCIARWIKG